MATIDGILFYDGEQQYLKLHDERMGEVVSLTASSMIAYVLMRSICDHEGHIEEESFHLKELCLHYDLPYSSIHRGYHRLYQMGLLTLKKIHHRSYSTLPLVETYARSSAQLIVSSYFRIPYRFLNGSFLRTFIKARDVKGLLCLLDLVNGLFREWSRKKNKTLVRKKTTFMRKFQPSTYAFSQWVKHVLQGSDSIVTVQHEDGERYELAFVESVFTERQRDIQYESFQASVRHSLLQLLKNSRVSYGKKDLQHMQRACEQELTQPMFDALRLLGVPQLLMQKINILVSDILQSAVDAIQEEQAIRSLGAYFRQTLRLQIRRALREEGSLRQLIANAFQARCEPIPEAYR